MDLPPGRWRGAQDGVAITPQTEREGRAEETGHAGCPRQGARLIFQPTLRQPLVHLLEPDKVGPQLAQDRADPRDRPAAVHP